MEALQFKPTKKNRLSLNTIPIPTITHPKQVLIKVVYAGISLRDIQLIVGDLEPNTEEEIFTLGDRVSGIVTKVGKKVKICRPGTHVTVNYLVGCNACDDCLIGKSRYCKNNKENLEKRRCNGAWANYMICFEDQIVILSEKVGLDIGWLLAPLSDVLHGWQIINNIAIGDQILIIGSGIHAKLWIILLHYKGHKNVTILESDLIRAKQLNKLDCGYKIYTKDGLTKKCENNPNLLFNIIIDTGGYTNTIKEICFNWLQFGGTLCINGICPPGLYLTLDPHIIYKKELKICGSHFNPFCLPAALDMAEVLNDKYMNLNRLGIKIFALSNYLEAFRQLKEGIINAAVFHFEN